MTMEEEYVSLNALYANNAKKLLVGIDTADSIRDVADTYSVLAKLTYKFAADAEAIEAKYEESK